VEYHWGPVALRADVERGCWSVAHHIVVSRRELDQGSGRSWYSLLRRSFFAARVRGACVLLAEGGSPDRASGTPSTSAGAGGTTNHWKELLFHLQCPKGSTDRRQWVERLTRWT